MVIRCRIIGRCDGRWIHSARELKLLDNATLKKRVYIRTRVPTVRYGCPNSCWFDQAKLHGKIKDEVPHFTIEASLEGWTPFRPVLTIELNGLTRTDTMMVLTGLDTELSRNVNISATISIESDLVIPRTTIDMSYKLGERLENARICKTISLGELGLK